MSRTEWTLVVFGLIGVISSVTVAQPATTILFDNTGAESGITVPGATEFSYRGSSWTGGVVATEFMPPLYASGSFAYEIDPSGGSVDFTAPVDAVTFFFVHPGVAPLVPSPRGGASGVWFSATEKMILFGGMFPITGDTLAYDPNAKTWTELTPAPPGFRPAERCHHSLVVDQANARALMFGGFSFLARFNDVWQFEPGTSRWTQLLPTGMAPARRCLHVAAFDPLRNQMLVYGGVQGGGEVAAEYFDDTHILDLTTNEWTLVAATGPGKLRGTIAFYSTADDAMYVWGGKQVSSYPSGLWRFDMASRVWAAVTTSGDVPIGREDPAFFFDDVQQRLFLFSGRNDSMAQPLLDDSYVLDLTTGVWQALSITGGPVPRWRASVVFDDVTHTGIMFGGWLDFGGIEALDDVWRFDAAGMAWSQDLPPGTATATAFDSAGTPIASANSHAGTTFADSGNFVTMNPTAPIARVELTGGVVDNFSFIEVPPMIPATSTCGAGVMAFVLLGWGILLVSRSATRAAEPRAK